jgi:hypothetical protein
MWYSNASSPYTITQNFTVFAAHTPASFGGFQLVFSLLAPVNLGGPSAFTTWIQSGNQEGNTVGVLSNGNWRSLQQAGFFSTTLGQPRIESVLSAPTNFAWTNGTENTFTVNNIGRGTATSGTSVVSGISMSSVSNSLGPRAYNGTIHEILVYSSNLSPSAIRQVEGYLGWKWRAYRNLVTTHPFYNIPTSSPLFVPTLLSNCGLWLDGLDPNNNNTLPSTGTSITTWTDKSGAGANGTSVGTAPTFASEGGLTFSAGAYNTSYSASLTNESLFVVHRYTTSSGIRMMVAQTGNGGRALDINAGTNQLESSVYNVAFGAVSPTNTTISNAIGLATLVTTNSNMAIWYNGTSFGTPTTVTITAGRTSVIGGASNAGSINTSQYFQGIIYEVIGYTRSIPTSERQQVEGYLAWKWGIQNRLPTTHPYYKIRS